MPIETPSRITLESALRRLTAGTASVEDARLVQPLLAAGHSALVSGGL